MGQHGASTVDDGRRRLQQQQRNIADVQRIMREGFTLRREIGWYPSEDKYQLCNPGGKFRAKISYTGEDVKYFAPDSSGREVPVVRRLEFLTPLRP